MTISSFPLAWWLIGDLSEDRYAADTLDCNFGRVDMDEAVATTVALVSLFVLAVGVTVLFRRWGSGAFASRRLLAVGLYVVGSVFTALCLRVMTAGTGGANIGGGLAVSFGAFVLLALFVTATTLYVTGLTARRPPRRTR